MDLKNKRPNLKSKVQTEIDSEIPLMYITCTQKSSATYFSSLSTHLNENTNDGMEICALNRLKWLPMLGKGKLKLEIEDKEKKQ